MTAVLLFDCVLALLIAGVAWFAISARGLFTAIMFFVVYGILTAVAWVRLDEIDVALAEAAIGAGLTGVLLVGAMSGLERAREAEGPGWLARGFSGVISAAAAALLMTAVLHLDPQSPGLVHLVSANLDSAGVENPVTAVLLNFRAYDTLLESMVLLAALIAIWSLAPDAFWGGRPGLRQHVRPDGVLATFGRILPPVGLMVGVYLVWVGTDAPGGAFQGGTVLAAVLLLTYMAGLVEIPAVNSMSLRAAVVAGPTLFLLVGVMGVLTGSFLALPVAWAKQIILAIELALAGSVAVILALVVAGIPRRLS